MALPLVLVSQFGTEEPEEMWREVSVGDLSFLVGHGAVRRVCWMGVELVRALTWPIRDENWGTYVPEVISERLADDGDRATYGLEFDVAEGALRCSLQIEARRPANLRAELSMRAAQPFPTNRAGLTVLHPIDEIVGAPVLVQHSDGRVESARFPEQISPAQPFKDIAGLCYGRRGVTASITFGGEVFEMEDQRNWSDASYKTYCVPLVHPFTYTIAQGECRTQTVDVQFSGVAVTYDAESPQADVGFASTHTPLPEVGLVVEDGWLDSGEVLSRMEACGTAFISARLYTPLDNAYLQNVAALANRLCAALDIEIVLPECEAPTDVLQAIAAQVRGCGLHPERVVVLPEAYLASHQPIGPWPEGVSPDDAKEMARGAFPDAQLGAGVFTNFTEFNRCRPDPTTCDYITHGNTAIVHAGDDLSVRETLETLPHIFASAKAIAPDKAYRLGLVAIGMRSNPYGDAVAENTLQVRRTMAHIDPRQRGLFGAAWAVGVLAVAAVGVDALALGAPAGPFGLTYRRASYPQPYFDDSKHALFYPLYHVFRASAQMAGSTRMRVYGISPPVYGFGGEDERGLLVLLANVSPDKVEVRLAQPATWRLLDSESFADATSNPNWLADASCSEGTRVHLAPYGVAFVRPAGLGTS